LSFRDVFGRRPVVAITGLEARDNPYPGCAVAKALRRARGDDVVLVGLAYDPLLTGAFRSDLFDRVYATPFPADPPGTTLRRLLEIHAEFPLDALIPTLDTEIAAYAAASDDLRRVGVRTYLPSPTATKVRYKDRLASFCADAGLFSPRTEVVADPDAFFYGDGPIKTPCYLKGPMADATRVETPEEAVAAFWRLAVAWGYPILAQEPIVGEEFDVCAVVDSAHEPLAALAIKKTLVTRAGKAAAAAVVDDPDVLESARRALRALRWRGPLELEFVRETSSGRDYLIEVNGRFPAWCGASPDLGINLPDLLLRLLLDEPIEPIGAPRVGASFARVSKTVVGRVEEAASLAVEGKTVRR
jgi:carbamoyl-phosphate synthase large subunit